MTWLSRRQAPRVAPPVDVDAADIQDLAYTIIRVTTQDGEAVGEWAGSLTTQEALDGLKDMMRLRILDARMMRAQRQGKSSFYMQALGEEAVACAYQRALEKGDMNFPTYRQQGLLIASGYPLENMLNQIYSNRDDPMKGRQLGVMYSAKEHGFFSISGNLATQFVQAVGWAMASAISGDDRIATGWIGDGSTAEGDFHAGLVLRIDLSTSCCSEYRQQSVGYFHLPGHGAWQFNDICIARTRFWNSRLCALMAMTFWPFMPSPNGLWSARVADSARH